MGTLRKGAQIDAASYLNFTVTIPEPSALLLLGLGGLALRRKHVEYDRFRPELNVLWLDTYPKGELGEKFSVLWA
ncbi:hypothetical protein ES703_78309 [subsurface metagenome]